MKAVFELLKELGEEQSGTNHSPDYSQHELSGKTLEVGLQNYFDALNRPRRKSRNVPTQVWTFELEPVKDWELVLRRRLGKPAADRLALLLVEELDWTQIHFVHSNAPTWYDCSYDDLALVCSNGNWLLHLGVSD